MKRVLALIMTAVMLLSLCACGGTVPAENPSEVTTTAPTTAPATTLTTPPTTAPAKNDAISPLHYKVNDGEGNTAWLFGSIHVGQDHFYPLPDYVTEAYENSDALAVEADMVTFHTDMEVQTQALMKLIYFFILFFTLPFTIFCHLPSAIRYSPSKYTCAIKAGTA